MSNYWVKTKDLEITYEVSREAVRLWREQGLPHVKKGEKTYLYDLLEVDNWLRDRGNKRSKRY